jgi:hypothetical protein
LPIAYPAWGSTRNFAERLPVPIDTQPETRHLGHDSRGRELVELTKPLVVDLPLGVNGSLQITVPAKFKTNYASTPPGSWWALPPNGPYLVAAIVHDWLYSSSCSRFLADAIFRDLMYETGVVTWQRVAMFYAVRAFGGRAWKEAQRKREGKA